MTPPPVFRICSAAYAQPKNTDFKLLSTTRYHSSSVSSSNGRWILMPALLTQTSTLPYRSATTSAKCRSCAVSVTSACSASSGRPCAANRSETASSFALLRPQTATRAPSCAKASAASSPIPEVPPVMATTLFFSPNSMKSASCSIIRPILLCGGETTCCVSPPQLLPFFIR